jgi:hypothetical protein
MSQVIGGPVILFTVLVPIIKVASAAVVETSTGAAAWRVSSDSTTDRCSLLAVKGGYTQSAYPSKTLLRQSQYQALRSPFRPQVLGRLCRRVPQSRPICGQHL